MDFITAIKYAMVGVPIRRPRWTKTRHYMNGYGSNKEPYVIYSLTALLANKYGCWYVRIDRDTLKYVDNDGSYRPSMDDIISEDWELVFDYKGNV